MNQLRKQAKLGLISKILKLLKGTTKGRTARSIGPHEEITSRAVPDFFFNRRGNRHRLSPRALQNQIDEATAFYNKQIDDQLALHDSRMGKVIAADAPGNPLGRYTYPSGTEAQYFKELRQNRAGELARKLENTGLQRDLDKALIDYVPLHNRPVMKEWVYPGIGLAGLGGLTTLIGEDGDDEPTPAVDTEDNSSIQFTEPEELDLFDDRPLP